MEAGVCGLGGMGAAMAARLLDQGHRVTVWNRSAAKAAPLLARGAVWAPNPAAVAAQRQIVITSLFDEAALAAVYDGADGLLSAAPSGRLFIDTSTVSPDFVRGLGARVASAGAGFLDCPVGGTIGPAREGKLLGMVGGTAADVARARPLLEDLCRRLEHLGPVGSGATMKLAINLPLAVYWEALGEACGLLRDSGVDPGRLIELFAESSGGANALKTRGAGIAAALRDGAEPKVGFSIAGLCKDLSAAIAVAGRMGFTLPVTGRVLDCYHEAVRDGWGGRDHSQMVLYRVTQARARRLSPE